MGTVVALALKLFVPFVAITTVNYLTEQATGKNIGQFLISLWQDNVVTILKQFSSMIDILKQTVHLLPTEFYVIFISFLLIISGIVIYKVARGS